MTRIDASFTVCALLGMPARHSMGPLIHNTAFEALGLPFVYVAHDVVPADLGKAMEGVRALAYRGLSITMPHKVTALSLVDEADELATVIGCINTVVNDGGRLRGYNTDGLGALFALSNAGIDPTGRRVTILGSGGAARAIAGTLALRAKPSELILLGVVEKELLVLGEDLRERTSARVVTQLLDTTSLSQAASNAEILLHCSPIGMTPNSDATLVPKSLLRSEMAVFDAVYNPRRTKLIQDAAKAGCQVVEGMEMFLGQAMIQFKLWTGCEAPAAVMRQVIEARL